MALCFEGSFALPKLDGFAEPIDPKMPLLLCLCKESVGFLVDQLELEVKSPVEALVGSAV